MCSCVCLNFRYRINIEHQCRPHAIMMRCGVIDVNTIYLKPDASKKPVTTELPNEIIDLCEGPQNALV